MKENVAGGSPRSPSVFTGSSTPGVGSGLGCATDWLLNKSKRFQRYPAHKKAPPSRTLQWGYAYAPTVDLEGCGRFLMSEVPLKRLGARPTLPASSAAAAPRVWDLCLSRAFLQDQFQCPPMMGVKTPSRTGKIQYNLDVHVQGYLAHKKQPPPLRTPLGP